MMCNVEPFKGGGRGSNVAYVVITSCTHMRSSIHCAVVFIVHIYTNVSVRNSSLVIKAGLCHTGKKLCTILHQ